MDILLQFQKIIYNSNSYFFNFINNRIICIYFQFNTIYLNLIFVKIGIIGTIYIYFSYFCFKEQTRLFFILTSWILFSFFLASSLFYIEIFMNYIISSQELSADVIFLMVYWFERFWFYSIPSLCIFASFGIIKWIKKIKKHKFFMKVKHLEFFSKFSKKIFRFRT